MSLGGGLPGGMPGGMDPNDPNLLMVSGSLSSPNQCFWVHAVDGRRRSHQDDIGLWIADC